MGGPVLKSCVGGFSLLPDDALPIAPKLTESHSLTLSREKVARLTGRPVDRIGDTQWIGHILKRLHLLDQAGRKRGMDGITYAVKSTDVIDMMRRYDVTAIDENR